MANKPRSAVFTTVLWDGGTKIADFNQHLDRLRSHAERLRIDLPEDFVDRISKQIIIQDGQQSDEIQLLNITYNCLKRAILFAITMQKQIFFKLVF